ncbi:hypothetical protein ACSBR2_029845 [Camellia fascicularis]
MGEAESFKRSFGWTWTMRSAYIFSRISSMKVSRLCSLKYIDGPSTGVDPHESTGAFKAASRLASATPPPAYVLVVVLVCRGSSNIHETDCTSRKQIRRMEFQQSVDGQRDTEIAIGCHYDCTYYCSLVYRYYVHVNCGTKAKFRESKTTIKIKDLDMANLIHLPLLPNESVNLIAQFVKQMNLDDNNGEVKLEQFSHIHPLTLCNLDNSDLFSGSELSILNKQNIDKICDMCVQPINASFYNCNQCHFFVHEWCSKLANKFSLVRNEIFDCQGCAAKDCIGFQFLLKYWGRGYRLDVKSASLPSSIMHKAHGHPLILKNIGKNEGCAACDQSCGMLSFGCGISSCSFNLHCACALLPSIFNHRYEEHPFILTYAPIENGPDEYWCEFCENQIDPKWWFYHCIYCDKSACAKCIREKEFPIAKLGATFTFASHPHPLTLVQATYIIHEG